MFDIGFSELVVIAVIALIVLGPERMPEAARALGSWVAKARRFMRTMSEELERETDFKGFRDLKDEFDSSRRKFEDEFDSSRRKFEDEWERSGRTGTEDYESESAASEAEDGSAGDVGSADDHGDADTGTVTNGSGAKRTDDVAAAATEGVTAAAEPKPRSKTARTRKPASSTAKPRSKATRSKPKTVKSGTTKPKAAEPKTTRSKPKTAKPGTTKPKAAESKTAKPKQTRKSAAGRTNPAPDQPDTHETVAPERERNA